MRRFTSFVGKALPLIDLPVLSREALQFIAVKHHACYVEKPPQQGMFNGVFALGDDLILRVPRDNPLSIFKTYKEQIVVPAARAVGVRTPAIFTFDDSLDLIAVPTRFTSV